jgi:hypothetical protein
MANKIAPKGELYVCLMCGKISKDKYGNEAINRGWDVSCMLNCALVKETHIHLDPDGYVYAIEDGGIIDEEEENI